MSPTRRTRGEQRSASRVAILDAAIRAISNDDQLVVMWLDVPYNTRFEEKELAELRFAKIAGEQLIYCDRQYKSPFSERFPLGRDVDLIGSIEHEQWVNNRWDAADRE
mgnify:CR=1 FL=1